MLFRSSFILFLLECQTIASHFTSTPLCFIFQITFSISGITFHFVSVSSHYRSPSSPCVCVFHLDTILTMTTSTKATVLKIPSFSYVVFPQSFALANTEVRLVITTISFTLAHTSKSSLFVARILH